LPSWLSRPVGRLSVIFASPALPTSHPERPRRRAWVSQRRRQPLRGGCRSSTGGSLFRAARMSPRLLPDAVAASLRLAHSSKKQTHRRPPQRRRPESRFSSHVSYDVTLETQYSICIGGRMSPSIRSTLSVYPMAAPYAARQPEPGALTRGSTDWHCRDAAPEQLPRKGAQPGLS